MAATVSCGEQATASMPTSPTNVFFHCISRVAHFRATCLAPALKLVQKSSLHVRAKHRSQRLWIQRSRATPIPTYTLLLEWLLHSLSPSSPYLRTPPSIFPIVLCLSMVHSNHQVAKNRLFSSASTTPQHFHCASSGSGLVVGFTGMPYGMFVTPSHRHHTTQNPYDWALCLSG